MKRLLLIAPLLVCIGCGSTATTSTRTPDDAPAAESREPWFCQFGGADEQWDCVRSAALAANPQPKPLPPRAPEARNDAPPPMQAIPPVRATPAAPATTAPPPAETAPPAEQERGQARASADTDVPVHIALSYQPKQAVSILDLPEDFWAVQLVALSSKEALEAYAEEHNISGMSAARIWNGQQLYYVLLLGVYETHDNAQAAVDSLTVAFARDPWIRSVGSLQRAMLAADEVAGTSEI